MPLFNDSGDVLPFYSNLGQPALANGAGPTSYSTSFGEIDTTALLPLLRQNLFIHEDDTTKDDLLTRSLHTATEYLATENNITLPGLTTTVNCQFDRKEISENVALYLPIRPITAILRLGEVYDDTTGTLEINNVSIDASGGIIQFQSYTRLVNFADNRQFFEVIYTATTAESTSLAKQQGILDCAAMVYDEGMPKNTLAYMSQVP